MVKQVHLYHHDLDFEENKTKGPFGDFANIKKIYKNKGKPTYDFFGISVHSPFGIAAGPLPTAKFVKAALDKGFDIVTLKSVRTDSFPVHSFPHVRPIKHSGDLSNHPDTKVVVAARYTHPLAAANSFGIPSVEPKEWQPHVKETLKIPKKGQALLVAFQGTARGKGREDFVQDHVKGIGLIKKTGAKIIEINLSCPNEGQEVLACFDTDITERIVRAVKKAHPDIKLIIKLAHFSNHHQLKDLIKKVGHLVDGISAINTMPTYVVDKNGKEVFPGRPKAGISGAPIKWAGLEMTRLLSQFRKEFDYAYKVIGMGGVLTAQDFHDYVKAGADVVMSVTGAMWNPNLAAEIKASL